MNFDNLDSYTLENIAQLLVHDPHDVASLRETYRYFAAAIPADLVMPINPRFFVMRLIRNVNPITGRDNTADSFTPEQLARLVMRFPDLWIDRNNYDIIGYITKYMSFAHMRVISQYLTDFNYSLVYSSFIHRMYKAIINNEITDAVLIDINAYYDSINKNRTNEHVVSDVKRCVETLIAAINSAATDDEKYQLIKNHVSANQFAVNDNYQVGPLLCVKFFTTVDKLVNLNLPLETVCKMVQICTDARIVTYLIKTYGKIVFSVLFSNCDNRPNNLEFWRDIHEYLFLDEAGQFTKESAKKYTRKVSHISKMIDESCSISYREYWRDLFMNRIVADQNTYIRIIDVADCDDVGYIVSAICNIDDMNLVNNEGIMTFPKKLTIYTMPRDVNMVIWLHDHKYFNDGVCILMFEEYINSINILIGRNLSLFDYLLAIYEMNPHGNRATMNKFIDENIHGQYHNLAIRFNKILNPSSAV